MLDLFDVSTETRFLKLDDLYKHSCYDNNVDAIHIEVITKYWTPREMSKIVKLIGLTRSRNLAHCRQWIP